MWFIHAEETRDMIIDVSCPTRMTGPDVSAATPAPPSATTTAYDFETAEFIINSFDDDAELAIWLANERK